MGGWVRRCVTGACCCCCWRGVGAPAGCRGAGAAAGCRRSAGAAGAGMAGCRAAAGAGRCGLCWPSGEPKSTVIEPGAACCCCCCCACCCAGCCAPALPGCRLAGSLLCSTEGRGHGVRACAGCVVMVGRRSATGRAVPRWPPLPRTLLPPGPHRRHARTASWRKGHSEPLVQRPARKKTQSFCACSSRTPPILDCTQGVCWREQRGVGGRGAAPLAPVVGVLHKTRPAQQRVARRGTAAGRWVHENGEHVGAGAQAPATHRVVLEGARRAAGAAATQEVGAVDKAAGVHHRRRCH